MEQKNRDDVASVLTEKINDLNIFCTVNKIPAVFMYAIEKNGKTKTKSIVLTPMKLGVELSEDFISPMVALVGTTKFKIVPVRSEEIFDETAYYPVD